MKLYRDYGSYRNVVRHLRCAAMSQKHRVFPLLAMDHEFNRIFGPMMKRFVCAAFLLAGIVSLGCDEKPIVPPPELLKNPPPEEPTSRPTTQELLEGPRRQIQLASMPLTVRVPAGWAVKNLDGTSMTFLEGPTPNGDVSIQLVERATTKPDRLQIMVDMAHKELKQFPDTMRMAELRDIPGAKVLERQRVGRPAPPSQREPGEKESTPFSWTLHVFVPRGADNYETCELNFIGLTADQYETDKALLRGIIDSIAVNEASNAATAPSAAPVAPAAR
jgi:hypothetical protein